jgi:hypothetical protein
MARPAYESGDLSSVRGDCLGRQCFQRHRNPPEARTPIRLMIRRAHRLQKGRRHAREERHHQRNAGADPGLLPLSVGWRGGSAGDGARGLRPRSPAAPGAPSMGGDRFPDHALCLHRACLCRHRWRWAFWLILVAFLTGRLRCRRPLAAHRCPAHEYADLVRAVPGLIGLVQLHRACHAGRLSRCGVWEPSEGRDC